MKKIVLSVMLVMLLSVSACVGNCDSGSPAVEHKLAKYGGLTRLKFSEEGLVKFHREWGYIAILEDTQTGEHYALIACERGITTQKLSK